MKNFSLVATQGRLVVKKNQDEESLQGGIVLASPVNKDTHTGVVISVGNPDKDFNQKFFPGSTVMWQNYSGVEYEFEGDTYLILNQKDIIAIVLND